MGTSRKKKEFVFPVSTLVGSSYTNFKKVIKGRDTKSYRTRYLFTNWISWILDWFRLIEERKYGALIENHEIDKPPVFVIGFWRSGTTILHNLLCENPDFGYVNTFQAVFPNHTLLNQGWLKRIAQLLLPEKRPGDNVKFDFKFPQEEEIALGNLQPISFYNFFYFPKDTEEFIDKTLLFNGVTEEEMKQWEASYLTLIKAALINTKGKQFVSKNPPNTLRIKEILKVFPNAKFIYIHRNTYETLYSFLRFTAAVREGIKHQDYNKEEQDLILIRLYKLMVEQYEKDKKFIPKGQLTEVDFAYFENNMIKEMERIYKEIDLPNFEVAKPLMEKYLAEIGDYKRATYNFPEEFTNLIDRELGSLVEK